MLGNAAVLSPCESGVINMEMKKGSLKNYSYTDYMFEKTTVRYVVMNETDRVFMLLIPSGMESKVNDTYETVKRLEDGFPNNCDWFPGSIAHLHLSHHYTPMCENSYKYSESTKNLMFDSQKVEEGENYTDIITYVKADEGYGVCHTLRNYKGENGFEVTTKFMNNTGKSVMLEMLTSASLDNICMFDEDDGSKDLIYHTFRGGWSTEGKHIETPLTKMNMEKSWGGSFECEKIGAIGSKTVGRYYPYAALEDRENQCIWGIKPKHNATWQIELSRYGTPLSLSCGMGDYKFGHWRKEVEDGGCYTAPVAYISCARGGIDEVSNDLLEMNHRDIDAYGEEGMPIIFNEWVTHWGDTSHDKVMSLARALKDTKVKYLVVDDGWQTGGRGDWTVNTERFPNGIKAYADEVRELGMIPGIWMEFESVCIKAKRWAKEYDNLCLTKDGIPVNNAACNSEPTKFLDFRKKEVIEHLDEVVIKFLKDNHIGYMKVDYNSNVGLGCDGADSLGQGLIDHMDGVYNFFKKIKQEIPDIILESCSTGGSRLEPKMMSVTAMSSFSDAHESIDVPIVAANMHYLISPRQNQVWCVLKEFFTDNHMRYVISSGFLGRLCWSGTIDKLSENQMNMLKSSEIFYEKVSDIIKHGRSTIYRTEETINRRKPQGTQAVVRYSDDKERVLVVCHFFENAKELKVTLNDDYEIEDTLFESKSELNGRELKLFGNDKDATVLVLKKKPLK